MALVIKGARLIDGTGQPPVDGAVVVIEGSRIQAVGPAEQVAIPAGDHTVIDAGGRSVLPALIESHGGIMRLSPGEHDRARSEKVIVASILRAVANGRRCLAVGVTTVRADLSGHHGIFALKEALAAGIIEGPRLIATGRAICMTGGHMWQEGCYEADGEDAVRKAAREELRAGADWIKLMATGGSGSQTERLQDVQMTVEELRAGVEEAHKKGKFAFAHVTSAEGARNCIAAGVDSIEHGIFLEEDIVQAMVEKGIFLCPTLSLYRRLVERGQGTAPDWMYRKGLQAVEAHTRSFRLALQAGVKIATGTDSGNYWNVMGDPYPHEMEIMHQEGMSTMEVIISSTSRAAELLRMQDDLGTLEAGKLADVVIVDGDPLANISAMRNTWLTLKEGRILFQRPPVPVARAAVGV